MGGIDGLGWVLDDKDVGNLGRIWNWSVFVVVLFCCWFLEREKYWEIDNGQALILWFNHSFLDFGC